MMKTHIGQNFLLIVRNSSVGAINLKQPGLVGKKLLKNLIYIKFRAAF